MGCVNFASKLDSLFLKNSENKDPVLDPGASNPKANAVTSTQFPVNIETRPGGVNRGWEPPPRQHSTHTPQEMDSYRRQPIDAGHYFTKKIRNPDVPVDWEGKIQHCEPNVTQP